MAGPPRYTSIVDLPAIVPVFPLTGVLLLPRARLPLNVFEKRYLALVDAAMAGHRLVGMIQPRTPGQDMEPDPALAGTGCVGRIVEYSETDDDRYLITLTGIARFHVVAERETEAPYREVTADYAAFPGDLTAPADDAIPRVRLFAALKPYLSERAMQTDWKSIEGAPSEMLVNSLAMLCPFEPGEKQMLLEARDLAERVEALTALIEFANAASPGAGGKPPIH
jgi:uncharacterized protein